MVALRESLATAVPPSYEEKVALDGLNEVLNMVPLPSKIWNILPYTAYVPPACCVRSAVMPSST